MLIFFLSRITLFYQFVFYFVHSITHFLKYLCIISSRFSAYSYGIRTLKHFQKGDSAQHKVFVFLYFLSFHLFIFCFFYLSLPLPIPSSLVLILTSSQIIVDGMTYCTNVFHCFVKVNEVFLFYYPICFFF